ncbi:MAG: hypothetical protein M3Y28_01805 [Armatimonadota bacterium]|nr:hypothetical protein [Armatimonadota bacterium]
MTTLQAPPQEHPDLARLRDEWTQDVERLEQQLTAWAEQEGWQVHATPRVINEESLGTYTVPDLVIGTLESDHLRVEVKGRGPAAASGLVQIFAWPTLFRVHLLRRPGQNTWTIRTDSGIPLHRPWNRDTFITLAHDLLSADE